MPIVQSNAYPSAEYVLNLARALVNDAFQGGAGRVLTDSAPATFTYLNGAIIYLQDELINHGIPTFTKEVILTPILPVTVSDANVYTSVSYTGYFDGSQNHSAPTLPSDLLVPWRLWERPTGQPTIGYIPMSQPMDGLPSYLASNFIRYYEWRGDAIYMLGANQSNDIRLRYEARLPGVAESTDNIQIRGSENILANLVAFSFTQARGYPQAAQFNDAAGTMIRQLCNRLARANQRRRFRKTPWSPEGSGWDGGYGVGALG